MTYWPNLTPTYCEGILPRQVEVVACLPQQTQSIRITFVLGRSNVFDVGPTMYKRYTNVFVFAGVLVRGGFYRVLTTWMRQDGRESYYLKHCIHTALLAEVWEKSYLGQLDNTISYGFFLLRYNDNFWCPIVCHRAFNSLAVSAKMVHRKFLKRYQPLKR